MELLTIKARSLPEAYHKALVRLHDCGRYSMCPDWHQNALEASLYCVISEPLAEPMISRFTICGPEELKQYEMEMVQGILDFEVDRSNWKYTYHSRMRAYGIHELDQVKYVIDELKRNPFSRRAVIDIRDNDCDMNAEPACLQHLQYQIRDNKLECVALFRSNDACKAFFMNAYALIRLQEYIAQHLGVEIGQYTHIANNFHCYEKDLDMLEGYWIRINKREDLTYRYDTDWKELMDAAKPDILNKVEELMKHG